MTTLTFQDLEFEEENDRVKASFLETFYFEIKKEELEKIGKYKIEKNSIKFENASEKKAVNKFNILIDKGIESLKSKTTKKQAVYIHSRSGIPLIGSGAFGIIDRNTNIIEVKPSTGCNQNCIFCSVGEGLSSKKMIEIVIEKDYIVQEFEKIAKFKECEVEAYINSHGEPSAYGPLPELIKDLKSIENVKSVVMNSNGSLIDEERIDELSKAGLKRLNLSLNAVNPKSAKLLAGWGLYDVERVKRIAEYASKKTELLIAPVWVPGFNDEEIPKIVEYAKSLKAKIGIQNFLNYKGGRNPTKQAPWSKFYEMLEKLEKEYDINLTKMDLKDEFNIMPTKNLPKPFRKGQIVRAEIKCPGRNPGEMIAAAGERNITIINCKRERGTVKAKILRTKHNIFSATAI